MMVKARNIMVTVSYDGSDFMGWQVQPSVRTVQAVVEDSLEKIFKVKTLVNASGRTDAGVHAFSQVASFEAVTNINVQSLKKAINSLLPDDISITDISDMPDTFHPRYSAKAKIYLYAINNSEIKNPLMSRYAMHLKSRLNTEAMKMAAEYLLGEHDFSSFMASGSPVKSTIRSIFQSEIIVRGDMIYYIVKGSGFLRHMVRNIVGTLIEVGKEKVKPEDIITIINQRNRSKAGPTAPPQGLYLAGVEY